KYNRIISRLTRKLTHPRREEETEIGNLFTDIFAEIGDLDVVLIGSGSIRKPELGPVVTLGELKEIYPYGNSLYKLQLTGAKLLKIFNYILRAEKRIPGKSSFYQVNKGVRAVYSDAEQKVESLLINGEPIAENTQYSVCVLEYHYKNSVKRFNLTSEELGTPKILTTSAQDVLEEYMTSHQHIDSHIEGRITFK
ncbi:MAG: 5'-nucleotidase, partial [Rivularia sp. (in: cyanobacteria)]